MPFLSDFDVLTVAAVATVATVKTVIPFRAPTKTVFSMEILDASEQITEPDGILYQLKGKNNVSA